MSRSPRRGGNELSRQSGLSDQTPDRFRLACARRRRWPEWRWKATFVETFLRPLRIRVVNPDAIAQALFPDAPGEAAYEAARVADAVRKELLDRGVSFCMETVFSDPDGAKLAFLREARKRGYVVILIFIGLESRELAIGRVMQRRMEVVTTFLTTRSRRASRAPWPISPRHSSSSITPSFSITAQPRSRIASSWSCAAAASSSAASLSLTGGNRLVRDRALRE